jgi:hypothetical protein
MKAFTHFVPCSLLALSWGCGGDDGGEPAETKIATIEGVAAVFNDAVTGRIANASVSVLEHPQLAMITADDGVFQFGVPVGDEVTLVLEHPDYPLIQTGTHEVPAEGIADLTFQVPEMAIYNALAAIVQVTPDPTKCQMVTTITREGGTILAPGAHGEANVTVTLAPSLPSENGPIYFNASVVPDKTLTESSEDGGVVYVNAPPGEYVMSGTKAGATLGDVKLKCRPGVLVNASPPRGMNVVEQPPG